MEIPNGKYRARGKQGALGLTQGDKEQVAVEFQLLADEYATQTITWFGYFTEKTSDRTIESLQIMGWEGSDLNDLSGIDKNEVELVIEAEEYPAGSGLWSPKVRWVNKVGGLGLAAPMPVDRAKAFAAQMKGKVLALKQAQGKPRAARPANGSPPPPPGAGEPPPIGEDDLLF